MQQPLISIIVPVYNVEQYLHKTIDSVLAQSYTNWELLLIDDGSPDNSGAICDEYATKDKRIKAFHKQNGGVSSARNVGLDNASGEWICFLDSDDWWEPCFLQNFIEADFSDVQLIVQGFNMHNYVRNFTKKIRFQEKIMSSPYQTIKYIDSQDGVHNGFLWHRLFNTRIIKNNNILFPVDIAISEDSWFFFDYMRFVMVSVFVNTGGYNYAIRKGSLTSKGRNYPIEVYEKLQMHYIDSLMALPTLDTEEKKELIIFAKHYACKMAFGRFVKNVYKRPKEKEDFINALLYISKAQSIFDVKDLNIHLTLTKLALLIKNHLLRDFLLRLALFTEMCYTKYLRFLNRLKNC